jgi:hypothetical protein
VSIGNGLVRVTPVLFCAAVFWERAYWSESTHQWDWVTPETRLREKPCVELEVSLDTTLGEVFDAACDEWGIEAGPDLIERGGTRANQFVRFGFVQPKRDADGVDAQEGYRWPSTLPVGRENGTVEQVPALKVTYRELLASSSLGLVDGDVTRPYVHPVIPQGGAGTVVEVGRLTAEAIRAAYGAVDQSVGYAEHTVRLIRASLPAVHQTVDQAVDEGIRAGAFIAFVRWLRQKFRRRT